MYLESSDTLINNTPLMCVENKLDRNNRWVLLEQKIPWKQLLDLYKKTCSYYPELFIPEEMARMVVGAFIVKCSERLSSEQTVNYVVENPYVQYFLGFRLFKNELKIDRKTLITLLNRMGELWHKRISEHKRKMPSGSSFCPPSILSKIAFHNLNGFVFIEPKDIVYIRAEGNYSTFFLGQGHKEMVTQNIGKIYLKLDRKIFLRTKRSCIINSAYLSRINISQRMCILSKDGEEFTCSISKEQISEFSRRIKG